MIVRLEKTFIEEIDKVITSEAFDRIGAIIGHKVNNERSLIKLLLSAYRLFYRVDTSKYTLHMPPTCVMLLQYCLLNLKKIASLLLLWR